jgi:putative addiction module component (TIGR02574 family)
MSVHEIEAEALLLSSQERAHLAEVLIASLDEDLALEQAWAAEAERRYEEIRSGRVQTIPAEQVMAELDELLR